MLDTSLVVVAGIVVMAALALLTLVAFAYRSDLMRERNQFEIERRSLDAKITQLETNREHELVMARQEATDKSRFVLKGQAAEIMVSHLPNFMYLPADMHFIGYPVDYVVFSGLTALRDNGNVETKIEIILLEIKQGQSHLTPYQAAIKEAIDEKRVKFITMQVDDNATVTEVKRRF